MMMLYLLEGVAIVSWIAGGYLLAGSYFLPETRLLLGGLYVLIGVVAAMGAAILWKLRR
jgi:hypothetical protein